MNPPRVGVALALLLAVGGCAKQPPAPPPPPSVPIVAEAERSRYFEAVNQHLEIGGTLYGYAEIDGDSLKLADNVHRLAGQLAAVNPALQPGANLDYRAIFVALGLDDIKALGFSSVRGADGAFRNREFFYTPGGRHGLLAVVGGPPAAFTRTHLAPPDADFYCENEVDLPVVYATVKEVAAKLGRPGAADGLDVQIKGAGVKLGLSLLDLIGAWRGRVTIVARADPQEAYTLPAPLRIALPKYSALVCVDGIGAVIGADLAKSDAFTQTTEGTRHFFTPKKPAGLEGLHPVLAVDGSSFYLATSPEFLREALDRPAGLEQNPDFQRLLAALGPTGNGVSYVTPRFFSQLRELAPLNQLTLPQIKNLFAAFAEVPVPDHPLMAVRVNLADGILVRSSFNRSLKKDIALLAVYNPVTIGLAAALIVPAIQRAQAAPPPRPLTRPPAPAVLVPARIQANLRVLWTLSNRYYRQNQATTATYDDLIGPGKTLPQITVWAGEDYRSITFEKGKPISVRTRDGRVFTYPPAPAAPPPPRRPPPE
jgi:hypothetical protein